LPVVLTPTEAHVNALNESTTSMSNLVTAGNATTPPPSVATLVVMLISLVLLIVLLIMDLKYIRDSRRIAKELNLPQGQWLRLVKTLPFDPIIEFFAVGALLAADIVQNWEHSVAGVLGAIAGVLVGQYRFRIQYVRAVPARKAIVFVRSRAEYMALGLLILVRFAAEQHRIPVVGTLTLLITFLLSLVVFESVGRAWFSYRRYTKDVASLQA
jgi:hypothetical protein